MAPHGLRAEDHPHEVTAVTLLPHQERVVLEKAELDDRLSKLGSFFESPTFSALDKDEQSRLWKQGDLMGDLSAVLGQRIAAFSK